LTIRANLVSIILRRTRRVSLALV